MTSAGDNVEKFFRELVEELVIPVSRYEQAEKSYQSLGDWLHRPESKIQKFAPAIYVQGSFQLGTAIRPINDSEEYDVDSVCELKGLDKSNLTQYELKQLLGGEINAYHNAKGMTKPMRERRRCWVLSYADGAQFHMDVLPALPNGVEQRMLLERARYDSRWADTAIAITDQKDPAYFLQSNNWPRSNPKGYAEWFRLRMATSLARHKQNLVESLQKKGITASIETLPDYRVRTPLQAAVMLLKRHRDIMFSGNPDVKPISIIISTLAGHSYGEEETIVSALNAILNDMDRYIQSVDGKYVVSNPTDPSENFADKWAEEPTKATAFFSWLQKAREDFGLTTRQTTFQGMKETISDPLGKSLADRTADRFPKSNGGLLRAASAAPAVSASTPTFGSEPRVPTKPKGFACPGG